MPTLAPSPPHGGLACAIGRSPLDTRCFRARLRTRTGPVNQQVEAMDALLAGLLVVVKHSGTGSLILFPASFCLFALLCIWVASVARERHARDAGRLLRDRDGKHSGMLPRR